MFRIFARHVTRESKDLDSPRDCQLLTVRDHEFFVQAGGRGDVYRVTLAKHGELRWERIPLADWSKKQWQQGEDPVLQPIE